MVVQRYSDFASTGFDHQKSIWFDDIQNVPYKIKTKKLSIDELLAECWIAFPSQHTTLFDIRSSTSTGKEREVGCEMRSKSLSDSVGKVLTELQADNLAVLVDDAVGDFLLHFTDLAESIPAICREVRNAFPMETEISLEIYEDPEISEKTLTLYIRQESYEENIIDAIADVRNHLRSLITPYWKQLFITTDFGEPRRGIVDAI